MNAKHIRTRGATTLARCLTAALVALSLPAYANPNPDKPSKLEAMQLPAYCHKEYGIASSVPMPTEQCGHLMNHYCKGLMFLNRAGNLSEDKRKRQGAATRARRNIDYTLRGMPPACPLQQEVKNADLRLRTLEMFLK